MSVDDEPKNQPLVQSRLVVPLHQPCYALVARRPFVTALSASFVCSTYTGLFCGGPPCAGLGWTSPAPLPPASFSAPPQTWPFFCPLHMYIRLKEHPQARLLVLRFTPHGGWSALKSRGLLCSVVEARALVMTHLSDSRHLSVAVGGVIIIIVVFGRRRRLYRKAGRRRHFLPSPWRSAPSLRCSAPLLPLLCPPPSLCCS